MQHKVLYKAIIFTALLVSALSACTPAGEEHKAVREISVTGEAQIKIAPDQVQVLFSIYNEAKELVEAKRQNDEKIVAVNALLQELNVDKKDIEAQGSTIGPRYNYQDNKQVLEAYTVNHQLAVTLKDIAQLPVLLDKLVTIGVDRMDGITYGVQDRAGVEAKAMEQAINDAKSKAAKALAVLGEQLGPVQQMTIGGGYMPQPMMMQAKMVGAAMADAVAPPSGDIAIQYSVNASFKIGQ